MANPADIVAGTAPRLGAAAVSTIFRETIAWDLHVGNASRPFCQLMLGKDCSPANKTTIMGDGRSIGRGDIPMQSNDDMIHRVVNLVGDNISLKMTVQPNGRGVEIEFLCAQRRLKAEKLTNEDYATLRNFIKQINPLSMPQTHLQKQHLEENALAWILECLRLDMGNNAILVEMIPSKKEWIFDAKSNAEKHKITWKVNEQSAQRCLWWFARNSYVEADELLGNVLCEESEEDNDENHKQAALAMTKLSQILMGQVECDACDVWLNEHMPHVDRKKLDFFLQKMRSNFVAARQGEVGVQNLLDKIRLLIQRVVNTMNCEHPSEVVEWIFETLRNDNNLTESDVEEDSAEMETDDENESCSDSEGSGGPQQEARVTRRTSAVAVPAVPVPTPSLTLENMSERDVKGLKSKIVRFVGNAEPNSVKMTNVAIQDFFLAMMTRVLDFAVANAFSVVVEDKLDDVFPKVDKTKDRQPGDAKKKTDRVIMRRLWYMQNLHSQNDLSIEIAHMMEHLIESFDSDASDILFNMTSFSRLGSIRDMEAQYARKDYLAINLNRVRKFLTDESARIVACFPSEDNATEIWEKVGSFYTAEMIRMLVQFLITVKQNDIVIQAVNGLMKKSIVVVNSQNNGLKLRVKEPEATDKMPQSVEEFLFVLSDQVVSHRDFVNQLFAPDEKTRKKFRNELNLIDFMKKIWWQLIGSDGPNDLFKRLVGKEREIYLKKQEISIDATQHYNMVLRRYGLTEYSQAFQEHAGWQLLLETFVLTWHLHDDYDLNLLLSMVDEKNGAVDRSLKDMFDRLWLHDKHPEDNGSEVDMEEVSEVGSAHASDDSIEAESSSDSGSEDEGSGDEGSGDERKAKVPRLGE